MFKSRIAKTLILLFFWVGGAWFPATAHEGHDHDKPPPLNLPVAPRVVAVTPQLELVGVVSGREQLTVFLHEFETNDPIAGARMTVSGEGGSVEAKADGAGVFIATAPWLTKSGASDLIFSLNLADGGEDLLTGRLEVPESLERRSATDQNAQGADPQPSFFGDYQLLSLLGGCFIGGVLATLLFTRDRRQNEELKPALQDNKSVTNRTDPPQSKTKASDRVLQQSAGLWIMLCLGTLLVVLRSQV